MGSTSNARVFLFPINTCFYVQNSLLRRAF